MRFKKKQVLCSNCGFLCWYIQHVSGEGPYRWAELSQYYREEFQTGNFGGEEDNQETDENYHICCLRRQWVWAPHIKGRRDYVNADDVRKPRQCVYYIGYQPAFGPEEHKELKREEETRRIIRNATLKGAAIGASAAIIAQLLYVLLGRGG